jgi:UDPglucose--hexose-1-phosphate uridylyltransferase
MGPEYRVDPETGDWHIVAPARAARPTDLSGSRSDACPFCPGRENLTPPEVFRTPADPSLPWQVRIVPNRYAVVAPGPTDAATGTHDVVIESPNHDGDLRFADTAQTAEVLRAMRERCRALETRRPGAIVVFRNHGVAAGTSLRHPHSQIVSLDKVPPALARRWRRARSFFEETGRCLAEHIASVERSAGVRVVEDTGDILVYQPHAASVSHQTVLFADDPSPGLAGASDAALSAMAEALPRVAAGLAAVRDDPAYNLVVHAGPVGDETAARWYRWYVGLYPRVSRRAGLELATGLGINPSVPEQTAPALRKAMSVREL